MSHRSDNRWPWLDLAAGLVAILAVVGVSIHASFVGSDLRAQFAVTAVAFFSAGLARGGRQHLNLVLRGLLVSCPGLLGTAALILNDGLHRIGIPIAVSATAILFTIAGLETRRAWRAAPARAALLATACVVALATEVAFVRALVVGTSLHAVDRPAPDFALTSFAGAPLRISDLRGRTVVLAYWASWCLPCRWEMPELESAYARLRADSTVVVLAVDAGWGGESMERGRSYLRGRPTSLPAAYDSGGAAASLGVHALPTILFIDRAGRVRLEHYGFDRSERVSEVILDGVRQLRARSRG